MIPKTAHFIWLGTELPWAHALSLHSAAVRGGFERVVLHCDHGVSPPSSLELLRKTATIEMRHLDPRDVLSAVPEFGPPLVELYGRLTQPAARANVLRAAILAKEGGVYLDTDTLTVGSLEPLFGLGAFCGAERIALPVGVMRSRSPLVWAKTAIRLSARELCRLAPSGYLAFRPAERFYPLAVNNAVLGFEPHHPFVMELLEGMISMPRAEQTVRYALGTSLLQDAVAREEGPRIEVLPPGLFYPLPPEISEHWFRPTRKVRLESVLRPDTVVVHWYASVRTKKIVPRITPQYVQENAGHQLFSALAATLL